MVERERGGMECGIIGPRFDVEVRARYPSRGETGVCAMAVTKEDLDNFHRFAVEKLGSAEASVSFQELLDMWRQEHEYAATVDDIRQGLRDYEAGKAEPLAKAFSDLRRDLGLPGRLRQAHEAIRRHPSLPPN